MTLTHWLFWLFDVLCKASKQGCLAMGYRNLPFHRFLWCFLLSCSPFHRWRTYAEKRKQKNREFSGFLLVILENPKSSTAHWPNSARKSHQCKEEPPMQSAAVYASVPLVMLIQAMWNKLDTSLAWWGCAPQSKAKHHGTQNQRGKRVTSALFQCKCLSLQLYTWQRSSPTLMSKFMNTP